ncbi:MAG: oligopeptide transporter, OPT family [Candidatus Zixiibacteriota bacterium]|nr:MAG: oligopeptide transporter, OPT family [candidate division Zixibacteria bacterium]
MQPYIRPSESIPEFTVRAVIIGILFGILFGAANTYLGLLVGITVSTSIPVAVMSVAFFRLTQKFLGRATILEANTSQTVGSASSSLASGVIFTIPALFLWGLNPPLVQMTGLAMLGGLLGILFMIPLRRYLIKEEHDNLPYPEGTACAKVLVASDKGGSGAGNVFLALGIGVAYRICYGILHLWKDKVSLDLPFIDKAQLGIRGAPALLGVGFILGPRIATIMVSGSLISWMVLIPIIAHFGDGFRAPLFPESVAALSTMTPSEIWSRYIRYVGAGAVAFGGIATIIRSIPTMVRSFKLGMSQLRSRLETSGSSSGVGERTDRDVPWKFVGAGVLFIVLALALVPGLLGLNASLVVRITAALAIALFAFFFVTVSSRIVGLVGVSSNPTSGMTIVTLLGVSMVFVLLGWTDTMGKATALMVGTVVCIAASIAGDTSQDLKTGFLVGATPFKQQIGELIGAATSATAVCAAIIVLNESYRFGSAELPAVQATLIKTILEGVLETGVPWGLIMIGVGLGIVAELLRVPSLPFAVGLYLPLSSMMPIFLGGAIRHLVERRSKSSGTSSKDRTEKGILFGSGLVGGEGLAGVGIALYAYFYGKPGGIGIEWPPVVGTLLSLTVFAALGYLLYLRTGSRTRRIDNV